MRQASDQAFESTQDFGLNHHLELLFNVVMADLHLSVLEQGLHGLSGASHDINNGMQMLASSAQLGAFLTRGGGDMQRFVERMKKARQRLDDIQVGQMVDAAARYELVEPSRASGGFDAGDFRLPNVALPPLLQHPSLGSSGLAEAKSRTAKNLSSLRRIGLRVGTLTRERSDQITTWATDGPSTSGDLPLQLVLREVEILLFETAAREEIKDRGRKLRELWRCG